MSKRYDRIARVYDYFSARTYKTPRKTLVNKMNIQPGDNVFLVGCGTGLIFPFLKDKVGDTGKIVGLDASREMLRQAEKRIRKNAWTGIDLIYADARDISPKLIKTHAHETLNFDHVIGELSFSVMPGWKSIMRRTLDLLKDGGSFGVLDGYRPKKDAINA